MRELLALIPGEPVRVSERPMAHAVSADVIRGVDCSLPTESGTRSRAIGTVSGRALISAGRVLQGSVTTRIERAKFGHRLAWPHYLSRPGVVEMIGKASATDVAEGFLAKKPSAATLDLGAVCESIISEVQLHPGMDHDFPFQSARTAMRWAALGSDDGSEGHVTFGVESDTLRSFFVSVPENDLPSVVRFCEDVALHDWVLTTLLRLVERSGLGSGGGDEVVRRLGPAVEHVMHVWMPGFHVPDSMLPLWRALERRAGFSLQREATVNRIRDLLTMRSVLAKYEADQVRLGGQRQSGGVGAQT
ncbi:SCO2521 family protein [Kibdelosporangium philippinense]|uniref:SCO2521 family protein n=1 Tax=Kibdelosporangium philippinense TaxID=211113 RepID=A0ABS8ZTV5_9PSEU|nr:SCO2521 family protein [Kibdelosporangium philippinense]